MSTELANQGTVIPGEAAPVAPAVTDNTQGAVEYAEGAPPAQDDTEARARAQGWVPKEEFRGPPENWRDAAAFVKRGEEEVPIMRERLRALERKLAEKDTQFTALERMTQVALQRQREQIVANYEAAMRGAAEVGDVQRYDQLRNDMAQAVHQHDRRVHEQVEPATRQPQAAPNDPELAAWVQQNTWFTRDPALQHAVIGEARALESQYPGMSVMDTIRHAEQAVRRRYADKFGPGQSGQATPLQAERPRALTFEGGSRMAGGGPRQRGAAELPAEARRAGERFVKEGIFKDLNAYAKDYFAQEGV